MMILAYTCWILPSLTVWAKAQGNNNFAYSYQYQNVKQYRKPKQELKQSIFEGFPITINHDSNSILKTIKFSPSFLQIVADYLQQKPQASCKTMFNSNPYLSFYPCLPSYPFYGFYPLITSQQTMERRNVKFHADQQCQQLPENNIFTCSVPTVDSLQQHPLKSKLFSLQKNNQSFHSPNISSVLKQQQQQKYEQPKSRNILPNNINLILSYVRRINRSGKIVARIIRKYKTKKDSFSVKQFYSYQVYLKENLHSLINKNALKNVVHFCDPSCSVFTLQEQCFYNKVCRALIYNFLKEECVLSLLNSRKMFKTKRKHHLESYRSIMESLKENSSE